MGIWKRAGDTNTYATNERTTSEKILSQSWEASEPVSFSLHTSTQNSVEYQTGLTAHTCYTCTYLSHHNIMQSGARLTTLPHFCCQLLTGHSLFHPHPLKFLLDTASIPAICVILYYACHYHFFPWSFAH